MINPGCAEIHCFRVLVPWTIGAIPGNWLFKWKAYAVLANAGAAIAVFDLCLFFGTDQASVDRCGCAVRVRLFLIRHHLAAVSVGSADVLVGADRHAMGARRSHGRSRHARIGRRLRQGIHRRAARHRGHRRCHGRPVAPSVSSRHRWCGGVPVSGSDCRRSCGSTSATRSDTTCRRNSSKVVISSSGSGR